MVPVVIFYVIFQNLDWHRFVSVLAQVNPWLILTGILYFPLVILLGAVRWHIMYILRPGYLWLAIVNYGTMVRRQGLIYTARELARGLRVSFMGRS